MNLCRLDLLDRRVFCGVDCGRKPNKAYRRLLETTSAYQILKAVWKESSFLSDEELGLFGMRRVFEGKVTAYGLAVALADSPGQVAKFNGNVRRIAIAAATFGLVERKEPSGNKVLITGTERLHKFMLELAQEQARLIREIGLRDTGPCGDLNGQ